MLNIFKRNVVGIEAWANLSSAGAKAMLGPFGDTDLSGDRRRPGTPPGRIRLPSSSSRNYVPAVKE
jgi:hypothetical protein